MINAFFLILMSVYCFADDEGQQSLEAAAKLVQIRNTSAQPFQMEFDFRAQINVAHEGHVSWKWANKNLWSWQLTMEDYAELRVRNGDMLYIRRNAPFTPLLLTDIPDLLDVFDLDPLYWRVRKMKHAQNGGQLDCVQLKSFAHSPEYSDKEVCLEPATKQVVSITFKGGEESKKQEFSNYLQFHDNRYPSQLKSFTNGSLALQAKVISLQDGIFDSAVFAPPQGAIVRRQCENMTHPIALKTPDPAYPQSASQNRISGTTTVALTVLPDGSVSNVQLVESAEHEMDKVTQEIVKKWKFKPAMCGTEPVAYDIHVEVNFRLSR